MEKNLYSVAICTYRNNVSEVYDIKNILQQNADWYNSVNSEPHITINIFECAEQGIEIVKKYLKNFCKNNSPYEIRLTQTGSYSNGAFYLSPDKESKSILKRYFKNINKNFPLALKSQSSDPHMTIGRQLSQEKLQIAEELFGNRNYNISFMCEDIVLRKLDGAKGQYFVDSRFKFLENPQQNLF